MKSFLNVEKMHFVAFLLMTICFNSALGQEEPMKIKVLSYNIHTGNPPSQPGVVDLQGIAKVINETDADLIALQEVDVLTNRSGKDLDQAKALADLTNRYYFFAKAIDHDGGEYGIAILSKFPIVHSEKYSLPMASGVRGEQRAIAIITVEVQTGKYLDFACTHLDLSAQARKLQIAFINDLLRHKENPVVLAGDLNARPDSEEMWLFDQYFTRSSIEDGFTFPVVNPKEEIDYILYTPKDRFKVKQHVVVQEHVASDHLPLLVELEMLPEKEII